MPLSIRSRTKRAVLAPLSVAQRLARAFRIVIVFATIVMVLAGIRLAISATLIEPNLHRDAMAIQALETAHSGMLDEETGLRAYLLTGNQIFLEPYRRGADELSRGNRALSDAIAKDRTLGSHFLVMRLAEQRWMSEWARQALVLGRTAPTGVHLAFVAEGKVLFDGYRAAEKRFSDDAHDKLEGTISAETILVDAGTALQLTLLVAMLVLARRQGRKLQHSVAEPVGSLTDSIRRIAQGESEVTFEGEGPLEVQVIAEALGEMSSALAAEKDANERRQEQIFHQAATLKRLLDLSRDFTSSLDLNYVVGAAGVGARGIGVFHHVSVWLIDPHSGDMRAAYSSDRKEHPDTSEIEDVARHGRTRALPAPEDSNGCMGILMPMISAGRAVGVLEMTYASATERDEGTIQLLEALAGQAATAIEAARLSQETLELSQRDSLTHLYNRRSMDDDLAAEHDRCMRYNRPMSFVLMDVDHFKRFNDTCGHIRGDSALKEIARIVETTVRSSDVAYRYGGEEFAILLPEADADAALAVIRRIGKRIKEVFPQSSDSPSLTASFGIASAPSDGSDPQELVAQADRALYSAKHRGRDRAMIARDVTESDATVSYLDGRTGRGSP